MVTLGKKTNSAYVFFANDPIPTLQIGGAVLHIFIPKKGRDACKRLPVFKNLSLSETHEGMLVCVYLPLTKHKFNFSSLLICVDTNLSSWSILSIVTYIKVF